MVQPCTNVSALGQEDSTSMLDTRGASLCHGDMLSDTALLRQPAAGSQRRLVHLEGVRSPHILLAPINPSHAAQLAALEEDQREMVQQVHNLVNVRFMFLWFCGI